MKKKTVKELFKDGKSEVADTATLRELLDAHWVSLFSAKLYVSDGRALGCLRIEDEAPVV